MARQFKPSQLTSGLYSISGSFSGSFQGDGSSILGVITSSYAQNSELLDGRDSTTYANTGSNIFIGQQVITGSVAITGSGTLNGSPIVTNIEFYPFTASYYQASASFDSRILNNSSSIGLLSGSYLLASSSFNTLILNNSGSISILSSSFESFTQTYNTGSFTGSYTGDGVGLYNIPASGIVGLNLSEISSGSVSASISPNNGLQVNTNVTATSFTGSLLGTSSYSINTISASYAQSASYAENSLSSSFSHTASYVTPLNQNVIITGSIYIPNSSHSIYFSGSDAPSRLTWNDIDGTLDLGLKGGNVTLQIGQETVARVVNKTDADLLEADFKIVRVRSVSEGGAQGQRLAVVLAQADNDADSSTTLGVVTETIIKNQEGFITIFGQVRQIDTTGAKSYGGLETWVDGDVLYVSPTHAGYLTNIKPISPQHLVIIGYVEYAHQNNGKIFVKVDNGWEVGELHDVLDSTTSSSYGDLFIKSGSVWINSKQLTGSYGLTGSLTATSFTGSLLGTSSYAEYAQSASYSLTSSYAQTASYVETAQTASYVLNAVSSSYATTASYSLSSLSSSYAQTASYALNTPIPYGVLSGSFGITIDGAGTVITTGEKGYLTIPYAGTITGWTMISNQTGDCVIDVWNTAGSIPTVANTITGTEKPTLSSQQINSDTSLTTWTTSVAAGDVFAFNVDSATTITRVNLSIYITKQ